MALTFDATNKVIETTASITDLQQFHLELRSWEASAEGAMHPITHNWKSLELGDGASVDQVDLVNGWKLKFSVAGSYVINGNLTGSIVEVPGSFVKHKTSVAYVTTSVGSSGPSAASIAAELRASLVSELQAILQIQTKIDATF